MVRRRGARYQRTRVVSVREPEAETLSRVADSGGPGRYKESLEASKITPVIDRTFALAETHQAINRVGGGHARGKVVITM